MIVRYDLLCHSCGYVEEVIRHSGDTTPAPCSQPGCTGMMYWKPSFQRLPEFKPVWHEHLDHTPVLIESREQYREELKKRNLRGPYWHGDNLAEI